MKTYARELFMIMVGSFLFAIAVNSFIIAGNLAEGGVTGVTIVLYYLFQWPPSVMNLLINSVLLVIGYKFLDRKTILYTIIFIIFSSIFLSLTESWGVHTDNVFINCIFGGIFMGAGIGVIVRAGGTSAGSTILAKIASKYLHWNISYALLFFDLIIVIGSTYVIGLEKMLVTIVSLFIATKVMDYMIEGLDTKKSITIISDKHGEIAKEVSGKINRGLTIIKGKGYYSNRDRDILYVVIRKQELTYLRKIVEGIDEDAFIIVHDVRDVLSKNFI
ncbi:YitT family protein [Bacillus testis]|uniref:YitT family protein n=1 Tax=Bacillus testis TaxID=1622072 RepID=UPI00067F5D69|nr:YitT family protein [Bacillus testis]